MKPFRAAVLLFGLLTYMICSNSPVENTIFSSPWSCHNDDKEERAVRSVLLLMVSVRCWKGTREDKKLAGKGQLS